MRSSRDERPVPVRRLRVLHVLPDLRVGTQHFVFTLAQHVDSEQFQFLVACLEDLDNREAGPGGANIEVIPLHHQPGWRGVLTFMKLVRLIHKQRVDVVHTHSFLDRLFAHPAALVSRIPVVHTLNMVYERAHDFRERKSLRDRILLWIRHSLRRRLELLAVKRYIAISQAVYDSYAPVVPDAPNRLALVYYGVPTERLGRAPEEEALLRLRTDLHLEAAYPILINVARLAIAQKDQLTLLRALSILRRRFPDTRLLLVGEGKDRSAIELEIESSGLVEAASLLGSRQDIGTLMALSDIFVFPSRYEGFGIAVAEAMAAGKPVVASMVAPLTELIQEGVSGYLAEPGNPEAFASAVAKLAASRALAESMGREGQRLAREKFDIGRCAQGWEQVYRTAVEEKG